jgi:hypothetical protein
MFVLQSRRRLTETFDFPSRSETIKGTNYIHHLRGGQLEKHDRSMILQRTAVACNQIFVPDRVKGHGRV